MSMETQAQRPVDRPQLRWREVIKKEVEILEPHVNNA
jgi:hypothetical protein